MGAIIVSIFMSIISITALIYYSIKDKKNNTSKKTHDK